MFYIGFYNNLHLTCFGSNLSSSPSSYSLVTIHCWIKASPSSLHDFWSWAVSYQSSLCFWISSFQCFFDQPGPLFLFGCHFVVFTIYRWCSRAMCPDHLHLFRLAISIMLVTPSLPYWFHTPSVPENNVKHWSLHPPFAYGQSCLPVSLSRSMCCLHVLSFSGIEFNSSFSSFRYDK